MNIKKHITLSEWIIPVILNLLAVITCNFICRLVYMAENWNVFSELQASELLRIYRGGLRFDLATICYINSLYIILTILPFSFTGKQAYRQGMKLLFVFLNSMCLAANLADSVYFQYIGRRCTFSVFETFKNDSLSGVLSIEALNHWYLILLFAVMVYALWKTYRQPSARTGSKSAKEYLQYAGVFILSIVLIIGGIRGGFDPEQRPLNNKEAKEYADRPIYSALVLNTAYSIIRTIGKHAFPQVRYFEDAEANAIFTPIHKASAGRGAGQNVVIIVLESFGSENSALLNKEAGGKGYMPFLDSLMQAGLIFEQSYSNGHCSIDGQASIHLSIPYMVESFFTSHAALNDVNGIGSIIKQQGYSTAYFHGADNGSLSLDGFAKSVGYDNYYGRNEYNDDSEWDHHWGIWDEPFMQFFATKMTELRQPFLSTIFTITSHHPFQIPAKYKDVYKDGKLPLHKTLRYTDMALRKFFDTASRQPWYRNTLFVLTGDHVNKSVYKSYQTDIGNYSVPIVFFHPNDSTFRHKRMKGTAQHIDIMPTILGYTGCKSDYIAFGRDLLSDTCSKNCHIGYQNFIYQITEDNIVLQFDGEKVTALYDTTHDRLLGNNLINDNSYKRVRDRLERKLKAVIQSYMTRMNENRLTTK